MTTTDYLNERENGPPDPPVLDGETFTVTFDYGDIPGPLGIFHLEDVEFRWNLGEVILIDIGGMSIVDENDDDAHLKEIDITSLCWLSGTSCSSLKHDLEAAGAGWWEKNR